MREDRFDTICYWNGKALETLTAAEATEALKDVWRAEYFDRTNLEILEIISRGGKINAGRGKPPRGLRPRFLVDEERKKEIADAMIRYISAGCSIPADWIDEYNYLLIKE